MADQQISTRMASWYQAMTGFYTYMQRTTFFTRWGDPTIGDFALGNPQDLPLPAYVEALQHAAEPQNAHWFGYKLNEPETQRVVAASLQQRTGLAFEPDDIAMTNAGFGALATVMTAILEPGDEVIFNLPPWFFYELLVVRNGGVPVKVSVDRETFDLDLPAIEAAITPRTRAIIINTPCNPTGKIYPPATLQRLATVLADASQRNGRTVYLVSDEPYNRIIFDGKPFHTPLTHYSDAIMTYSYGKTLLAPGQRIGYVALPPTMANREPLRQALLLAQVANGYLFPNALLQHAVADLEVLSIDIARLQQKRDRMVAALQEQGYDVHVPEGTFYLLPRSPWEDDWAFVELLEQHDIFCLPGTVLEFPGFFRISLTASEEMIERSLPGFGRAIEHACTQPAPI